MRRLLVILASLSAPAYADGFYFTESVGGADVKSELSAYIPSAVHVRIALGLRHGPWALESHYGAVIGNEDGTAPDDRPDWDRFNAMNVYGLDLKYIQPMTRHVEAYLRGGVHYAHMDDDSPIDGYSGRGLGAGAGPQLEGKIRALGFLCFPFFFLSYGPKITGALYIDASYSYYRLHPEGQQDATPALDTKITTLSGGFAIGSDF